MSLALLLLFIAYVIYAILRYNVCPAISNVFCIQVYISVIDIRCWNTALPTESRLFCLADLRALYAQIDMNVPAIGRTQTNNHRKLLRRTFTPLASMMRQIFAENNSNS